MLLHFTDKYHIISVYTNLETYRKWNRMRYTSHISLNTCLIKFAAKKETCFWNNNQNEGSRSIIEAKQFLNWWSILFLIMSSWEHPLIRMESIAFMVQPFHQFLVWCLFFNYDNVPFRIAKHEKWFSSQFRTTVCVIRDSLEKV